MKALRSLACAVVLLFIGSTGAQAGEDIAGSAAALGARFAALKDSLRQNQFQRPLHLDSSEGADRVSGEIHAIVDHPFATVGPALDQATQWCDILILHLNTKHCRPETGAKATLLHVTIGKKFDQPVDEAYRVDFVFRVAARTADYLQVNLNANEGPLGTSNYRIVLEAAPAEGRRTYIRLAYSYSFGSMGRLAMQAYLGTIGRDKVGFTVVSKETGGQPRYVGGMRGVVERNTMRYYFAIESYLGALSSPQPARMEKSLRDWHAAVERYPLQLHDMDRAPYLEMKRREYSRQQAQVVTTTKPAPVGGG